MAVIPAVYSLVTDTLPVPARLQAAAIVKADHFVHRLRLLLST